MTKSAWLLVLLLGCNSYDPPKDAGADTAEVGPEAEPEVAPDLLPDREQCIPLFFQCDSFSGPTSGVPCMVHEDGGVRQAMRCGKKCVRCGLMAVECAPDGLDQDALCVATCAICN